MDSVESEYQIIDLSDFEEAEFGTRGVIEPGFQMQPHLINAALNSAGIYYFAGILRGAPSRIWANGSSGTNLLDQMPAEVRSLFYGEIKLLWRWSDGQLIAYSVVEGERKLILATVPNVFFWGYPAPVLNAPGAPVSGDPQLVNRINALEAELGRMRNVNAQAFASLNEALNLRTTRQEVEEIFKGFWNKFVDYVNPQLLNLIHNRVALFAERVLKLGGPYTKNSDEFTRF